MYKKLTLILFSLCISYTLYADNNKRYQTLSKEIRCVVCQGQSIADSNAPIAKDMQRKIQSLLEQHKTDSEIRQYLSQRYGDSILLRPPVNQTTWLLWAFPFLACVFAVGVYVRRSLF